MSNIDKSLLLVAAAVFAANPDMQSCGVTPNGQAFVSKVDADKYIKLKKQKGEALLISREQCAAEIAELTSQPAPAEEAKKEEAKKEEAKPLYTGPDGKALFTNAELKAEVKARNLEVADNKNATLIAALEAADIAAAEASNADAEKGEGEGEGEGQESKTEDPQA